MNRRILGFQYEPELAKPNPNTLLNYDADNELSQEFEQKRDVSNISEWCKCGNCYPMPSQQECLCCHELDHIKYKLLDGKKSVAISFISLSIHNFASIFFMYDAIFFFNR